MAALMLPASAAAGATLPESFTPSCPTENPDGGSYGGVQRDMWEWNGSEWRQVNTVVPDLGEFPMIVFDPRRGVIVAHRATASDAAAPVRETWEWDGSSWYVATAASGPFSDQLASRLLYDPETAAVIATDLARETHLPQDVQP